MHLTRNRAKWVRIPCHFITGDFYESRKAESNEPDVKIANFSKIFSVFSKKWVKMVALPCHFITGDFDSSCKAESNEPSVKITIFSKYWSVLNVKMWKMGWKNVNYSIEMSWEMKTPTSASTAINEIVNWIRNHLWTGIELWRETAAPRCHIHFLSPPTFQIFPLFFFVRDMSNYSRLTCACAGVTSQLDTTALPVELNGPDLR